MNIKLLFISLGYFLVMVFGLISCEKDNCSASDTRLKVVKLDWSIHSAAYSDTVGRFILSEIIHDSVDYNLFTIHMVSKTQTHIARIFKNNSFNLINSAYACPESRLYIIDKIDSILIFSNEDFNSTHLAGANLSELFDVFVIDQSNNPNKKLKMDEYTSSNPFVPNEMFLILNSPPSSTKNFEFTVKYFQDGIDIDSFEYKTSGVVINK